MSTRHFHRITVDIGKNFALATLWVDLSGILDLLGDARRGVDPSAPGRRAKYGQYTTRGLMVALCEMALSGREMSIIELAHTLWFLYTDQMRAALGMPDICDAESLADLELATNPRATLAERRRADAAKRRVEQRVWEAFEQASLPINDNAKSAKGRHTNAEIKQTRAIRPELAERRVRREQAICALIQGSLYAANHLRYEGQDPKDLSKGILSDWYGDVAIDETEVDSAIATGRPLSGPDGLHPATELAGFFKHSRRLEWPHLIGLTLGITVSRPGKRRVPTLAFAGSINDPSPASLIGALAVLDSMIAAGLRPPVRSNSRQYVISDMAYSYLRRYGEEIVLKRGYAPVMIYRSTAKRVHPLSSADDTSTKADAAHLFNGVPVCPGISRKALEAIQLDAPRPRKKNDQYTYDGKDLDEHDKIVKMLEPVLMPRHGRPEIGHSRGPGRPRVGIEHADPVIKLRVMCPAAAGISRCPLVPESMEADPSLPLVPDAPIDNPPSTCKKSYTTVRMSRLAFKHFQEHLAGTHFHQSLYSSARSRNESFHSLLIRSTGGNLVRGNTKPNKNAFTSLAVAMAVGTTNLKIMDRWDEVVSLNNGNPPFEPYGQQQRIRHNILTQYREHQRRRNA